MPRVTLIPSHRMTLFGAWITIYTVGCEGLPSGTFWARWGATAVL
jgi:hypothetical protein